MDCGGKGELSEDNPNIKDNTLKGHIIKGREENPEKLYYRNGYLDTVQAIRILFSMEDADSDRVGVYGASQGGALPIICSTLQCRVRKNVAIYPFLSNYKRALDINISNSAYEEIYYYFKFIDPNPECEQELFTKLGYIDIQHFAERIQTDVLLAVGMKDRVLSPSSQFAVYNKIKSSKNMLIYYGSGYEYEYEYIRTLGDRVHLFFKDFF
jgi:cephalosporin-C deacetylase